MREIRQVKRYGCSFCKFTATAIGVISHEARCFFNPLRGYCERCSGERGWDDDFNGKSYDCFMCLNYDKFIASRFFGLDGRVFESLQGTSKVVLIAALKAGCADKRFVYDVLETDSSCPKVELI